MWTSIGTCGSNQTTHGKGRSMHRKHGIKHKAHRSKQINMWVSIKEHGPKLRTC